MYAMWLRGESVSLPPVAATPGVVEGESVSGWGPLEARATEKASVICLSAAGDSSPSPVSTAPVAVVSSSSCSSVILRS